MSIEDEIEKFKRETGKTGVLHKFPIPAHLRSDDGVTEFCLAELTFGEEQRVTSMATENAGQAVSHQLVLALRSVNGERVSESDGTAERALARMKPKTRVLVNSAFSALHAHRKEDISAFLATREVVSG